MTKTTFKTTSDELRLTSPIQVQEAIDKALVKVTNGKSFVRPSGTEPVVKIYAEAATEKERDQLLQEVKDALDKLPKLA